MRVSVCVKGFSLLGESVGLVKFVADTRCQLAGGVGTPISFAVYNKFSPFNFRICLAHQKKKRKKFNSRKLSSSGFVCFSRREEGHCRIYNSFIDSYRDLHIFD